MSSLKSRVTLLLNWYTNPYHTPILVAQQLGFYSEEDIKLAILEPADPSDVTEIVGLGTVDFGVKAMIHTVAAKAKGYPVTSIGTLLDEPPTGLIALKSSGINSFQDIVGEASRLYRRIRPKKLLMIWPASQVLIRRATKQSVLA
ncbi:thiamine biosynthesis protein NMT-1 [Legionella pneumophila]|nr:thiamine biosynthesis protein NMT-1 [Legionella pneumophila]